MARPQQTDADLSGDLSPDAALRRIAAACRADLERHRAVVLKSRRPVGIHQTRVALRRLRAAFNLFKGTIDDPDMTSISDEARWIAGELAPARDLHVFLKETAPDAQDPIPRIGRRLQKQHHERARQALSGPRYKEFAKRLAKFAATTPTSLGPPLATFGAGALRDRHVKVSKRGQHLARLDAEELHKLRIAVKKQRYAAGFLRDAFTGPSKRAKAYIEATARLQGVLGSLNDRAEAARIADDIAEAARPSEKVAKPLARLAKQVKKGTKKDHRRLARAWKAFREVEPFW